MFLPVNGFINKGVTWLTGFKKNLVKICRYFSTFDGSSSYAALTDEIVLSGNFEIEFKFKQTAVQQAVNTWQTIISFSTPLSSFFTVHNKADGDNSLKIGSNGHTAGQSLFTLQSDTEYKINVIVNQTTGAINVNIDDVFDHSYTHTNLTDLQNLKLEKIGERHDLSGRSFNGQLSDIKIWSNGDRNTGDLILDLPMSEGLKDVYDEVFYRNRVQAQAEWLLNLDGGYVEFQPITLSGDFEIEIKIGDADYSAGFNTRVVLGNLSNNQPSIAFTESNSSLRIRNTNGQAVNYSVADLNYFKNGTLRVVMSGSSVEAFFNDVSLGVKSLTSTFIFNAIASYSATVFRFDGQLSDLKIWSGGDRNTGTLIIDSALDDNSNIIANAASPVNANAWDDSQVVEIGDSEILGDGRYRIYSPDGSYSAIRLPASVSPNTVPNTDYLVTVELESGSITSLIAGDLTTDYSGWQNIRDAKGQPTSTYTTIYNSSLSFIQFKRFTLNNAPVDFIVKNITVREVEGYGVLQGTRGTDYEWKNGTPHAIGYNVETNEVCTTDGTNWIDSDLWSDSEAWSD